MLLAKVQLLLAVSLALIVGLVVLLQSFEVRLYSKYSGQFTAADDSDATPRGPLGYTPAGFANVARLDAQQLSSYTIVAASVSGILVVTSVIQLVLVRSFGSYCIAPACGTTPVPSENIGFVCYQQRGRLFANASSSN
jgi:hypothetical protein